jgi:hypothetical protein
MLEFLLVESPVLLLMSLGIFSFFMIGGLWKIATSMHSAQDSWRSGYEKYKDLIWVSLFSLVFGCVPAVFVICIILVLV